MSCITYFNNDTSGLVVYVSGYTCYGVFTATTLTFGQGICMDNEYDIITCGNADIGAECLPPVTPSNTPTISLTPSVTRTPTQTPTNTSSVTPTPTPSVTIGLTPTHTPQSTQTPTPTTTTTLTATPTQTPTKTSTQTPTPTKTSTPQVTPSPTGTSSVTPTPTSTPPICDQTIYSNGALIVNCSDYCNTNYNIQTVTNSSEDFSNLSIGDFVCGFEGQTGYLAYSSISTDTNTGPFYILDLDASGEVLGINECSGGSCIPI